MFNNIDNKYQQFECEHVATNCSVVVKENAYNNSDYNSDNRSIKKVFKKNGIFLRCVPIECNRKGNESKNFTYVCIVILSKYLMKIVNKISILNTVWYCCQLPRDCYANGCRPCFTCTCANNPPLAAAVADYCWSCNKRMCHLNLPFFSVLLLLQTTWQCLTNYKRYIISTLGVYERVPTTKYFLWGMADHLLERLSYRPSFIRKLSV